MYRFLAGQLNQLIKMAGQDEWHMCPMVLFNDEWLEIRTARENFGCLEVLLEDGTTQTTITEEQARQSIQSTVECFAHSEDEILEWMGQ